MSDPIKFETDFAKHCQTCKHEKKPEVKEPCCVCLSESWNEESDKPIKWEAKTIGGKK